MADPQARTPNGFLVFLGSSAAIAVVIVVIGALIAKEAKVESVDQKRAQQRVEARKKLDQADLDQMTSASWVDKEKGVVRLPIGDAIKLVATELARKKPAPSQVKVDPPLPMPPPYDPNSKEPPVSALPSSPQGAVTIRFDLPAAPVPAPAPAPASAPVPAPAAPVPAAPPAAMLVPAGEQVVAQSTPARLPLIHLTENSELKK